MKPDDIPQDVWDAALEAMPPVVRKGISESPVTMTLRLGIARAIMAAKAEERSKAVERYRDGSGPEAWDYFKEAEDAIRQLD